MMPMVLKKISIIIIVLVLLGFFLFFSVKIGGGLYEGMGSDYVRGKVVGSFKVTLDLIFVDEKGSPVFGATLYVFCGSGFESEYINLTPRSIFHKYFVPLSRIVVTIEVPAIYMGTYRSKGKVIPFYKEINLHVVAIKKVNGKLLIGDKLIMIDPKVKRSEYLYFKDTLIMKSRENLAKVGSYDYNTLSGCVEEPPLYKEELIYQYSPIVKYAVDQGITGWIVLDFDSKIDVEGKYRYYWFDEASNCWKVDNYWMTSISPVYADRRIETIHYSGIKTVKILMKVKFRHYIWQIDPYLAIEEIYVIDTLDDPLGTLKYVTRNVLETGEPDTYLEVDPGRTVSLKLGNVSYWQFTVTVGLGFGAGPSTLSLGVSPRLSPGSNPLVLSVYSNPVETPGLYVRVYSYDNSGYEKSYSVWLWYGPH